MKCGILVLGNAIVDVVQEIDVYPKQGNLATVLSKLKDTGGNVCNVLIDLAMLGCDIPLSAAGFIGDDSNGNFIISKLQNYGIDVQFLHKVPNGSTSLTEVMVPVGNRQRTFFFHPGSGADLSLDFIQTIQAPQKIVQLGYLGTLPKLEIMQNRTESYFSNALKHFLQQGCITAIDMVSGQLNDNLRKVFFSCLPYTSFLIINEVEAGNVLGKAVRDLTGKLLGHIVEDAAEQFLDAGVLEAVVIHCPEKAFYFGKNALPVIVPSFEADRVQSTLGAGDAFTAAFLYGVHAKYSSDRSLRLGHAAARLNLDDITSTGGAKPLAELIDFIENKGVVKQHETQ